MASVQHPGTAGRPLAPAVPRRVDVDGLGIALLEDGPADGPLALCLHGFPDTAYTWRHLLPVLAGLGYHAVAPFLRGYAPTDIPPGGHYQTAALASDANGLHRALTAASSREPDRERASPAVLIGHDWGALTAYHAAALQPDRWGRLICEAVPPPATVVSHFFSYDQLRRSWYTFFFQSPLAELAVPLDDYAFFDRLWADWSPGYDASWDLARVKEAIGTPERMVAAISYYRDLYDPSRHDPSLEADQQAGLAAGSHPTLYVHGDRDGCFAIDAFEDPLSVLAEGSQSAVLEGAGHFAHLEQPEAFAGLVADFLAG